MRSARFGVNRQNSQFGFSGSRRKTALAVLVIIQALFCACLERNSSAGDIVVRLQLPALSDCQSQTIPLMLVDEDPNIVFCLVKFERVYASQDELLGEFFRTLAGHQVCRGAVSRAGEFIFRDIPPGRYWVITSEPVLAGDERLVWSHPVRIGEQDSSQQVVLQRSNAAMVLDSADTIF